MAEGSIRRERDARYLST